MIELGELVVLKNLSNWRESFHATFNGGHHDDGNRRAFHHGMDTVFNGIDARIKELEAQPPAPTAETKRERHFQRFDVNDTIRMPHYDTVGKGAYRVWQIIGEHLGATHQEGTYALKPLDIEPNEPIHVPCLMLETHPEVEKL